MTPPADQDFHEALRRADIGRLADRLDVRACSPDVFGRLVRHENPRVRYLGLTLLTERLASDPLPDDVESAAFAALLPGSAAGPPEAALVLAGLHERLGPHLDGRPWPLWRAEPLPVRVRIAWLRAELLNDPTVLREEPPGELLYQAVRGASVADAHRPGQLVDELARSSDPVLTAAALRLARQGLHAGLLAPALVRDQLMRLLGAGNAEVTADVLKELAEPWAALDPLPAGLLSPFSARLRRTPGRPQPRPRSRPRPGTDTTTCSCGSSTIPTCRRVSGGARWNSSATWPTVLTSPG